uniref:site-specific DNA-methyltransferase (adenine-specific) n=1 Tax=Streptomyces sp. NBC_00003 TaxID=2903608 RepID=A0AAU2V717_9ACTN
MKQFDLFGELETKLAERASERATAPPKPATAQRPARSKNKARKPRSVWTQVPRNPHQTARTLGENVAHAWHSNFGGSLIEIPIGVVAALTLLREPVPDEAGLAQWILNLDLEDLPKLYSEIWGVQWAQRPDLIDRARPLHRWLEDEPYDRQTLLAVRAVTHTAIDAGVFALTGWDDPDARSQTDVLSYVLMELRSKSARSGTGEFHTPAEVCDLLAQVMIDSDSITPGGWIAEPCVGSGGMLRAAAQRLRDLGCNPHDYKWFGVDIDPIAAACAATNAIVWDLGPQVVIARGNALSPDMGLDQALEERAEIIRHRNNVVQDARWLALFKSVDRLLSSAEEAA